MAKDVSGAVAAALAAAFCWAIASLLWRRLPTSLPAVRLNLLKNLLALTLQLPLVVWLHPTRLPWGASGLLVLSGVVGIAMGDSLYFAALRRLGTRRTLTLEAGGPALTTLAAMVFLGEAPRPMQGVGIALICGAVMLVACQGSADQAAEPWRLPRPGSPGRSATGIMLAIAAVFSGSCGALLARAALRAGDVPPLEAATVRLLAACLVMLPLLRGMPRPGVRPQPRFARWPLLLVATLLGTSAGLVLQQTALAGLPGGLAVALLSTAPVMAVPLAPLEGDHPGWLGAAAALLAVLGVSLAVGLPLGSLVQKLAG